MSEYFFLGTTPVTSTFSFPATGTSSGLNFGTGFGATTTTSTLPTFNQSTFNSPFSLGSGTTSNTAPFGGIPAFGGSTLGSSASFLGPNAGFGQANVQQATGSPTAAVPFATTPYKDSPLFYNLLVSMQ